MRFLQMNFSCYYLTLSAMLNIVHKKAETNTSISRRKLTLTSAPITPRLVSLRYTKGLVLLTVCRNGYKNSGIWAAIRISEPISHKDSLKAVKGVIQITVNTRGMSRNYFTEKRRSPKEANIKQGLRNYMYFIGNLYTVCSTNVIFYKPWRNADLVSGCEATHCRRANALHTRLDWCAVKCGGLIAG